MRWLHLSDIHFNMKGYDSKNIRKQLLIKLKELNVQMDFILITGDCLFQFGSSPEQEKMIKFIKDIANACNCPNKKVYICPGNHDVDRTNISRNELIDDIRNGKKDFSENYKILCGYGYDRFHIIYKGVTSYNYEPYKVFAPRNGLYRIISIDSCLLSKDKEDCHKLKIFNEKIHELGQEVKDDNRINILIMHHGIECLNLADAKKFEHWVEDNNIDIICCGHTHRAAVNSYDDLQRDIKQFTAGAIVVDDYAIPSFYICEWLDTELQVEMTLYTYAKNTENWILDNQLLRKFKDGIYIYNLSRFQNQIVKELESKSQILKCKTTIDDFNTKYFIKFGCKKIYSNKHDGPENFDSWKIIHSLVEVGVDYTKALEITFQVIEKITDDKFQCINKILSSEELRNIVYDTIIHFQVPITENEYTVGCWASRYARKYNRSKEIIVIDKYGGQEKLNYSYIKNQLLKKVIDSITNSTIFFEKIFRNELSNMAEDVLNFLKNMGIFEIREDPLLELIKEYVTQKPHPWLVNQNRENLIKYHKQQATIHIQNLKNEKQHTSITQMEAAYHICAAFLVQYDDYIGCKETSPITILTKGINNVTNKNINNLMTLPMQKYEIIQLKKDLKNHDIEFEVFKKNVNILYDNIVIAQKVFLTPTKKALIELWGMLLKLDEPVLQQSMGESSLQFIRTTFSNARGFVVKANLRELKNCFWVEPNWEKHEIYQQNLSKQMLVCMLNDTSDVTQIYQYLYSQNKRENISEIVFVFENLLAFTNVERKEIRGIFRGKYVKCIFIQQDNFDQISKSQGWRSILFKTIQISKTS